MPSTITTIVALSGYVFVPPPAAPSASVHSAPTRLVSTGTGSTTILRSDVFIPLLPAGSGYPAGLKSPTSLVPAGGTNNTILKSECYLPQLSPGSGYPPGLPDEPIKPVNKLPFRPRAHDSGTVGVAFGIPGTYDYGWNNPLLHPLPTAPRSPRHDSSYTYQTPPIPGVFPAGLSEPQRPQNTKPAAISRLLTPRVMFNMPLDYSGWAEPNPFPAVRKPTVPRFNAEPSFMPTPIPPTYDYGWFAAPRLPVPPIPWKSYFRCPEYFPWENAVPAPPEDHRGDPWRPPDKKKKKGEATTKPVAPWERSTTDVRASLMAVVEANRKRAFDKLERQDEADLMVLMKKMGLIE